MLCLSTCFSDSVTTVRRRVDIEVKDVACPDIVVHYNIHMGGVHLADQAIHGKENYEVVETGVLAVT